MVQKALILGVTGQDGSYLSELLLGKGHEVHGVKRRSSLIHTDRVDHLYDRPDFYLYYGDMTDALNLVSLVEKIQPTEVYNLAAQSHVKVSFELPEYTANVDAIGTLRLLEAIRITGVDCKFYQASTSELFGNTPPPQNEQTPFSPRSPYGVAKLYSYWITVNYREAYNMFACNGILFNHESPRRGKTFVTRKITEAAGRIANGSDETLQLGNLEARRDWGHAKDYVKGMWLMLQQESPDDYVLATGKAHSVREFCSKAFSKAGIELQWHGKGLNERGVCNGRTIVKVNPDYFRPTEVNYLEGDASKARSIGWKPEYDLDALIEDMLW